ncbi:hypothetical protein HaLaN_03144 [Haematococcus lacustris]|uniref:Uncharacterized protein n=1 Tax=Haematococcus lacustris TaxID=44745 RepID=A0A699YN38_HAELA|nr:hypothetical protein HaLaN_03144 [Haematococcus lacustris]
MLSGGSLGGYPNASLLALASLTLPPGSLPLCSLPNSLLPSPRQQSGPWRSQPPQQAVRPQDPSLATPMAVQSGAGIQQQGSGGEAGVPAPGGGAPGQVAAPRALAGAEGSLVVGQQQQAPGWAAAAGARGLPPGLAAGPGGSGQSSQQQGGGLDGVVGAGQAEQGQGPGEGGGGGAAEAVPAAAAMAGGGQTGRYAAIRFCVVCLFRVIVPIGAVLNRHAAQSRCPLILTAAGASVEDRLASPDLLAQPDPLRDLLARLGRGPGRPPGCWSPLAPSAATTAACAAALHGRIPHSPPQSTGHNLPPRATHMEKDKENSWPHGPAWPHGGLPKQGDPQAMLGRSPTTQSQPQPPLQAPLQAQASASSSPATSAGSGSPLAAAANQPISLTYRGGA